MFNVREYAYNTKYCTNLVVFHPDSVNKCQLNIFLSVIGSPVACMYYSPAHWWWSNSSSTFPQPRTVL